jgi:hypothetical protein
MKTTTIFEGKEYEIEYDILAPSLYVYRNAIPKEWNVIERIENALCIPGTRFAWQQAGVSYGETDQEHRKCVDFKIHENDLNPRDEYSSDMLDMHADLIRSLKICLEHYKPNNYLAMIDHFEAINIVRYGKGEFFKVHTDDGDPYRCTVSAVGYPNDDYEGGELWFPLFDLKYKPVAGDWVVFPSAYAYAHSSEPVTNDGVKYSFVTMTDRNTFAHRNDSPIFHSKELRKKHGVLGS